jgi:hypothetical protein
MDTIYSRWVAHLVSLAQHPGSLDHAKAKVAELEACESGLWVGLGDAVRAELGRAKVTVSEGQSKTKPR